MRWNRGDTMFPSGIMWSRNIKQPTMKIKNLRSVLLFSTAAQKLIFCILSRLIKNTFLETLKTSNSWHFLHCKPRQPPPITEHHTDTTGHQQVWQPKCRYLEGKWVQTLPVKEEMTAGNSKQLRRDKRPPTHEVPQYYRRRGSYRSLTTAVTGSDR